MSVVEKTLSPVEGRPATPAQPGANQGGNPARYRGAREPVPGRHATPDAITARELPSQGFMHRLLKRVFPVLDTPPASRERAAYVRRQSFTDELPWVEYLPEETQIAFADSKTVMACYELNPVPTEGRSVPMLRRIVQDLVPLLNDVVPEEQRDPWVVSIYGNFEQSIEGALETMRQYVQERARGSAYTEDYLARMAQHYEDVTGVGGYFHDDLVSDTIWRGQTQRVRLVLYRRYRRTTPHIDTSEELSQVCQKLENTLRSMKIKATPMDGQAFHHWMRGWFNPRPRLCGGDPKRLGEILPYPGDENLPFSADLAESMMITPPVIDDASGLWYFDDMPHVVLQTESLSGVPEAGSLTGEIERYGTGKRNTTIEQLPEGTVIALSIIIKPREKTDAQIESISSKAFGQSASAQQTVKEVARVLKYIEETKEPIYPAELSFYIRAPNLSELYQAVSDSVAVLSRSNVKVLDPFLQADPVRSGNFLRGLPGNLQPSVDERAARRARLIHANHILRLAPLFGRSRGTGNPGLAFFNRSGEPLFTDIISEQENMRNAHTFIYGMSGVGKSALSVAMLDSLIAMHRPRIFIIDLGGSFDPLALHAKALGVSTHVVKMNMASRNSMPPFADSVNLVGKPIDADYVEREKQREYDMKAFAQGEPDLVTESGERGFSERDVLGEQEILARLMVEAEGASAVRSATLKISLQRAILMAAERAVAGALESHIPRPGDVADALSEIALRPENETRRDAIEEMANSMRLFCSGLNDHLFNRDGEPWPEVDLTIVDMADAGQSGRTGTLIIAVVSLVMHVNRIAERDQYTGRPIIFLTDEGHMITKQTLLMELMVKITKMWRKINARFWLATQEIEDIPDEVKQMIGMMENWIAMSMPPQQVEKTRSFRTLTDEQASMMKQAQMNKGKFAEGTIIREGGTVVPFRSVPAPLTLALSQTSPNEKAARRKIMDEEGITELDAIHRVAEGIRQARLQSRPGLQNQKGPGREAADG